MSQHSYYNISPVYIASYIGGGTQQNVSNIIDGNESTWGCTKSKLNATHGWRFGFDLYTAIGNRDVPSDATITEFNIRPMKISADPGGTSGETTTSYRCLGMYAFCKFGNNSNEDDNVPIEYIDEEIGETISIPNGTYIIAEELTQFWSTSHRNGAYYSPRQHEKWDSMITYPNTPHRSFNLQTSTASTVLRRAINLVGFSSKTELAITPANVNQKVTVGGNSVCCFLPSIDMHGSTNSAGSSSDTFAGVGINEVYGELVFTCPDFTATIEKQGGSFSVVASGGNNDWSATSTGGTITTDGMGGTSLTSLTLTASNIPDNYVFDGWYVNGTKISSSLTTTVDPQSATTYTAVIKELPIIRIYSRNRQGEGSTTAGERATAFNINIDGGSAMQTTYYETHLSVGSHTITSNDTSQYLWDSVEGQYNTYGGYPVYILDHSTHSQLGTTSYTFNAVAGNVYAFEIQYYGYTTARQDSRSDTHANWATTPTKDTKTQATTFTINVQPGTWADPNCFLSRVTTAEASEENYVFRYRVGFSESVGGYVYCGSDTTEIPTDTLDTDIFIQAKGHMNPFFTIQCDGREGQFTVDGGTPTSSASANSKQPGDTYTLTAIPGQDYLVDCWKNEYGEVIGHDITYTLEVPYEWTDPDDENGEISPNNTHSVTLYFKHKPHIEIIPVGMKDGHPWDPSDSHFWDYQTEEGWSQVWDKGQIYPIGAGYYAEGEQIDLGIEYYDQDYYIFRQWFIYDPENPTRSVPIGTEFTPEHSFPSPFQNDVENAYIVCICIQGPYIHYLNSQNKYQSASVNNEALTFDSSSYTATRRVKRGDCSISVDIFVTNFNVVATPKTTTYAHSWKWQDEPAELSTSVDILQYKKIVSLSDIYASAATSTPLMTFIADDNDQLIVEGYTYNPVGGEELELKGKVRFFGAAQWKSYISVTTIRPGAVVQFEKQEKSGTSNNFVQWTLTSGGTTTFITTDDVCTFTMPQKASLTENNLSVVRNHYVNAIFSGVRTDLTQPEQGGTASIDKAYCLQGADQILTFEEVDTHVFDKWQRKVDNVWTNLSFENPATISCLGTREDIAGTTVFVSGAWYQHLRATTAEAGHVKVTQIDKQSGEEISGGVIIGAGKHRVGIQTYLTAQTDPQDYSFDCWRDHQGHVISTDRTISIVVEDDASEMNNYTAVYNHGGTITITTYPEGAGTTTGSGFHVYGSTVTLTATSNDGYIFDEWTGGEGTHASYDNPYQFTMGAQDLTFIAKFEYISKKIFIGTQSLFDQGYHLIKAVYQGDTEIPIKLR